MNRIYILIITCLVCISSCEIKTTNEKNEITESTLLINLDFYASGSDYDPIYSIRVVGDSMTVMATELHTTKTFRLSHKQEECLTILVKDMQVTRTEKRYIEDSWGITLRIDDTIIYKTDDFGYENTPKHIRALIAYLVYLSPIEIELREFS